MNIKGLRLNRTLIKLLNNDIIDVSRWKGLDSFINFQWKGFNNGEFYNLLNAFEKFDKYIFKNDDFDSKLSLVIIFILSKLFFI